MKLPKIGVQVTVWRGALRPEMSQAGRTIVEITRAVTGDQIRDGTLECSLGADPVNWCALRYGSLLLLLPVQKCQK
jgi:hypothetical protein